MAWYRCVGGAGGSLKLRTASGSIATFSTNMVEAFKSLKSDINPVQDLHGYSKPWSGGGGKNKANKANDLPSGSGITITVANDGTLTINGTSTETCFIRGYFNCPDSTATYTWALFNNKAFESGVEFSVRTSDNSSAGGWARVNATNKTFSFTPSAAPTKWQFQISSGITFNNAVFKPMIVSGNTAPTDFEPYENICPISGFSALNVTRTGKNLCFDAYGNKASENTYLYPSGDNLPIVVNNALRTAYAYVGKNQDVVVSFANAPQRSIAYGLEAYPSLGVICHSLSVTALSSTSFKLNSGNYDYIAFYYCNDLGNIPSDCQIELGNQASDYTPYNGQTATVNFGQTVYGGVADVTNGKVTLTHGFVDLGSLTWVATGDGRFKATITDLKIAPIRTLNLICSVYQTNLSGNAFLDNSIYNGSNEASVIVYDSAYASSTASAFKTAMSGVQLVYELATPIEITTTPEYLSALSGQTNNVYGDTNGDMEVKYLYRE